MRTTERFKNLMFPRIRDLHDDHDHTMTTHEPDVRKAFTRGWLSSSTQANEEWSLPLPRSLDRDHLHVLESRPYLVSWKSNGERRVLFAAQNRRFYWIDRHTAFHEIVGARAQSPNVFAGTILDGEWFPAPPPRSPEEREAHPPRRATYVVFDCVCITGTRLHQRDFRRRLFHAVAATRLIHLEDTSLRVKTFVCATQLSKLIATSPDHPQDGLIFMPLSQPPVSHGTAFHTFKWKSKHTVDLWIRHDDTDDRGLVLVTEDCYRVNSCDASVYRPYVNQLVECVYHLASRRFVPDRTVDDLVHVRTDKPKANTRYVLMRTVEAIRHAISLYDLQRLRYIRC